MGIAATGKVSAMCRGPARPATRPGDALFIRLRRPAVAVGAQPAAGLNSRTPVPGLQPLNLAAAAAARRLAPTLSGGGEGHDTTLTFSQKHHGGK